MFKRILGVFGKDSGEKPSETFSPAISTMEKVDRPALADHDSSVLDLAFAMDCTGSMGSYIRKAQSSIRNIVEEIVAKEKSDIRLALVEYRDHPPQDSTFVTRVLDFTSSVGEMKKRLDAAAASGGGDAPEAVADALHDVLKLSWRETSTKICVFISDAPPHGLESSGDGFPNGCPKGLDPMQTAGSLAQKGVTMYMVGCEPSINRYKDFFMAIAHLTGGQYVPLRNAELLAKVIIGGAQEEITLERLMEEAQQEVEEEVQAMGGWDRLSECEDAIGERVMRNLNSKGVKMKQLQMNKGALAEASSRAKNWSNLTSMSAVQADFASSSPQVERSLSARSRMGADESLCMAMPAAAASPMSYDVVETEEVDMVQTKRMLKKMKNKKM